MRFNSLLIVALAVVAVSSGQKYTGVNIAGGEWGVWSNLDSIQHFLSLGYNTIRIPFAWEKVQTCLFCDLNEEYFRQLEQSVNYVTSRRAFAVVDLHNYMRYNNQVQSAAAVKDVWIRLAQRFKDNQGVIWGLMNEPNSVTTEEVLPFIQGALDGVRSTGARQMALIPGNGWCSAGGWTQSWYGTPNSQVMSRINDPINRYAFELHTYFDEDRSGKSTQCRTDYNPAADLQATTDWMRQNGKKAFLGEFGFGENDNCYNVGNNFLNYVKQNSDVYIGWTAWAAGSAWPANYELLLEPSQWGDRGQVNQVLNKFRDSAPNPDPTSPNPTPTSNGNCAPLYGQCGGKVWNGPTCCSQGNCNAQNEWYSQCV